MCHSLGRLYANKVENLRYRPREEQAYKVPIPHVYHLQWRFKSIELILRYDDQQWIGVLPYSRWANRASLHIRCDRKGTPLEILPNGRKSLNFNLFKKVA